MHEEMIDGKPLTQIINETNENVKYLKGAKFTPNVVADPSIESALEGATMICFCLPHQFLKPMVPKIKASVAPGAKYLSAIKGIDFDDKGIVLISDIIRNALSAIKVLIERSTLRMASSRPLLVSRSIRTTRSMSRSMSAA